MGPATTDQATPQAHRISNLHTDGSDHHSLVTFFNLTESSCCMNLIFEKS